MLQDLLNKQVICPDPSILQFMYPNFKRVKTEFEIFPDEPFIWNGDHKYIDKVKKHTELHIIIANTGDYDLTDMKTLVDLAYIKHGKFTYKVMKDLDTKPIIDVDGKPRLVLDENGQPIKIPNVPQYMDDLLKAWAPKKHQLYSPDFLYTWKHLWVTGTIPDKEIRQNKLFMSIIENMNQPYLVLQSYLKAVNSGVDISRLEYSLLKFMFESMRPQNMTQNKKLSKGQTWMVLRKEMFYRSYSSNVSKAVDNHLRRSKYLDSQELCLYLFLYDILTKRENKEDRTPQNIINVTYKNKTDYTDEKKYLVKELSRAKEFMTTLLLGELGCTLFKQIYKGDMYTLKSAQDVREFRETYNFGTEEVLVFEDLSLMTPDTQAALLKFIEEPKRPLIVLCSQDNLSGAMYSRFAHKVKLEAKTQITGMSIQDFIDTKQSLKEKKYLESQSGEQQSYTDEEILIDTDFQRACLQLCPDYWYYSEYAKEYLTNTYNLDMYIGLLNYK